MSNLNKIETFAVIDLETNNLPDYNFNRANITELCIHTVSKNDLGIGNINENPRIINKLTMVFNPQMLIDPEATKKTGLDNYMLEEENTFDINAANTIIGFLNHLRQPVCLVAHNGDNFDFPILKRTFEKLEMSLPDNLLCLDTFTALKEIDYFILNEDSLKNNYDYNLGIQLETNSSPKIIDVEKDVEFQKTLYTEYTNILEEKKSMQKLNETTPKRPPEPLNNSLVKRQRSSILSNHDGNMSTKHGIIKSRRVLFSPLPNSSTPTNSEKSCTITKIRCRPKYRGYFRLDNIYKRLFNKVPEISHQAEADVIILLKIMMYYGRDMIDYSDHNAVLFSTIKPLGTPQAKKPF